MKKERFDALVESLAKLTKLQRSIVCKMLSTPKHKSTAFYQHFGAIGGKKTAIKLTAVQKHARAVKAAKARWSKPKVTQPTNEQPIFLQFCKSSDIVDFESRHYVRKLANGDPRGHHGQQIHYLIWYNGSKVGAIRWRERGLRDESQR